MEKKIRLLHANEIECRAASVNENGVNLLSDGELSEMQTANYFSNLYPVDCAVPSVDA